MSHYRAAFSALLGLFYFGVDTTHESHCGDA